MTADERSGSAALQAARALAPTIRALGDDIERERKLPVNLVEAMRSAGLFHLTAPHDLNGVEAHPRVLAEILEEVSAADGSAGWCLMIAAQNAALCGFLDREAASTIFANRGIVAGVARPIGRAVPQAGGGFSVSGRWPFASGSSHADCGIL